MFFLASFTSSFSQLSDGEIAPNWTLVDINGNSHTLYDYLDSGKVVVIDVSATWCGPCWSYHNSHALKDVYETYGPNGTDEIMVFFIEGDATTTLDDLNGTGSNTYGDWVTGTPYPIINSTSINGSYHINYFPTIYMICPDRVISEIGQKTTAEIYTLSQTCPLLTTNYNDCKIFEFIQPIDDYCQGTVVPKVKIQNYGTDALTSLKIHSLIDGVVNDSVLWTGNLDMYDFETIIFSETDTLPDGNHTFTFQSSYPNSQTDQNTTNDAATETFSTNSIGTEVTVKVKTDTYPDQTSWEIKLGSTVVASGGNFDIENKIYIDYACLYQDSCYQFIVYDSGNNGLSGTSFGLIMWNSATQVSFGAADFNGSQITLDFCLIIQSASDTKRNIENVSVFPNPSNNLINIFSENFSDFEKYHVRIINSSGKEEISLFLNSENKNLNTGDLNLKSGIYGLIITDKNNCNYKGKFIIE
jgi:hypothetical protein